MSDKHPTKDWVRERRDVGIYKVPLDTAITRIRKAAEGLESPTLEAGAYYTQAKVCGWRPKTDKDRKREADEQARTQKAQAERQARDAAYRSQQKAEQEARDAAQAKALVDQLRKAGYVIVKGKGA